MHSPFHQWSWETVQIFAWIGIVGGIVLGLICRPRWSGLAGWWPLPGPIGHLAYGAWAGIVFGGVVALTLYRVGPVEGRTMLAGSVFFVIGLALAARLGGSEAGTTRAHLVAGAAAIALGTIVLLALKWYLSRISFWF